MSSFGFWWSSSVLYGSYAWNRVLNDGISNVERSGYGRYGGLSVRCLKD
jgi:hypothetical protein